MDPASRDRRLIACVTLGVALALSGCTWAGRQTAEIARLRGELERPAPEAPAGTAGQVYVPAAATQVLPERCSRGEAEEWAAQAETDPGMVLKAAACLLVAARDGNDQGTRLADAKRGRALVERVLRSESQNGLAHYLYAYLTGLVAENNKAQGLRLVPIIEREALEAARLDPKLDHGGPDRLLGELYLKAPSFPMSVGDFSKAVFHFKRAVSQAPGHVENRLGLVEALLAEGEDVEACGELMQVFQDLGAPEAARENHGRALELWKILCGRLK